MQPYSPKGSYVILLKRRPGPLERELAAAVAAVLDEWGCAPDLRSDGDPAALETRTLLLLSDCVNYDVLPVQLAGRASRPRVILWQMHPLPPMEVDRSIERIGLRAARIRQRIEQSAKCLAGPLPSRAVGRMAHELAKLAEMPLYRLAARRISRNPNWRWPRLDWHSTRAMLRRYAWIQAAHADGWLDRTCTTTPHAADYLRSRGLPAAFVPLGAHPSLAGDLGLQRDLDVVFLGRMNRVNRADRLNALAAALHDRGVKLTLMNANCYGQDRARLLNRAKVLVNFNKYPWDTPWLRFLLATGCGAAVISEPLEPSPQSPWRPGEHFVEAPPATMASETARLARDEAAREVLVGRARHMVRQRLSLDTSLRSVLREVNEPAILEEVFA